MVIAIVAQSRCEFMTVRGEGGREGEAQLTVRDDKTMSPRVVHPLVLIVCT